MVQKGPFPAPRKSLSLQGQSGNARVVQKLQVFDQPCHLYFPLRWIPRLGFTKTSLRESADNRTPHYVHKEMEKDERVEVLSPLH